jgi:hypothetical protein
MLATARSLQLAIPTSRKRLAYLSEKQERKLWMSPTAGFLKHADRHPDGFLSADELNNGIILMAACAAYVELMHQPTPEIFAYIAFCFAKRGQLDDIADEVRPFARQLQATEEPQRYDVCANFIKDSKSRGLP